jgi:YHS domain-containing protein
MRHSIVRTITRTLATISLIVWAASTTQAIEPVYRNKEGLALRGHDPVAYFTDGKPVAGKPEHRFEWMGATFLFANAEHRDQFAAEPAKYAPQFGGYCAWAVARGYTAETDPQAWRIVDGKLYLNYNLKVREKWDQDRKGYIGKGEANWPKILKGEK